MALDEPHPPKGIFKCHLCELTVPYTYFGQKPPSASSVILLEECYVMMDPFTPEKDTFLVLGSTCSLCKQAVCVAAECSIFYYKRFCLPCVTKNRSEFPPEKTRFGEEEIPVQVTRLSGIVVIK